MVTTSLGRVVYDRKKHVWSDKDVKRIQVAYAEEATIPALAVAIKETFRNFPGTFEMSLSEIADTMTEIRDTFVEVAMDYAKEVMLTPLPWEWWKGFAAVPAGIPDPVREYGIRLLEEARITIEGR